MENEIFQNEQNIDEIGYMAKLIDKEMTIFQRMKIKKSTLLKIMGALFIYSITMILFALFI